MSQINSYAKSNKNSLCENLPVQVATDQIVPYCEQMRGESSGNGRHLPGGLNI